VVACPYCGEKISPEAKLCRFCNRNTLYSLVASATLDEKQAHLFLKAWQALDKKDFRHLPLSNYSQAKSELSKIPLTLAWDLSKLEAELLSKTLSDYFVEAKLQGGLPSTFVSQTSAESAHSSFASFFYAALAVTLLVGSGFVWFQFQKPNEEKSASSIANQMPIETQRPNLVPQHQNTAYESKTFGRAEMDHLLNASVFIKGSNSLGSGFLITSDGYLLSNAHVTSSMAEPIVVLRDGREFKATKVKEDSRIDAALLKIPVSNGDFLKLGNANELFAGQPVLTIGNPGGLSFTVTRGIVSYVGRTISGVPFIQTDAAINRGNSGGPMINENLEVVGINSLTSLGEQGISFALPINLVCADRGIASGIGTSPSRCETFASAPDTVTPASLERKVPEPKAGSESVLMYQSEVNSLKAEYEKQDRELAIEFARIDAQILDYQRQAAADLYNIGKQESIQKQIQDAKQVQAQIPRKRAEAQLRYFRQIISVLQRQKADPDFSGFSTQIDQQIAGLLAKQKDLEASLER
jgi:S1-C subfamily serine protease